MSRTLVRRFASLFPLVAFAGGGIGLERFDALLFGHESKPLGVSHLDPLGGCGAHTEHCVLARAAAVRPLGAVAPIRVQLFAPVTDPALRHHQSTAVSAELDPLHTARPPPAAS
jgi:hypothetical protein